MVAPLQLPFEQADLLQPAPLLRRLQAQAPVHRIRTAVGDEAWLVTGYEQVRRLLADDRLGRSHPDPGNAARSGESALFGGPLGDYETEQADGARMRSLLAPHFSPNRMRALRPRVEALTGELCDQLAERTPPVDLNEALALPLPLLVICELLGVPYADHARFRAWTDAAGDVRDRGRSEQGLRDLFAYCQELVSHKRRHPGEDVMSRLCAVEGLRDDEVAGLSMSLLFAGHETTVVQIGMGMLLLLAHPDQRRALLDDPDQVGRAVEEVLRAPGKGGGGIPRYARCAIELDGDHIAAGDLVLLDNGAANHDPAVFADPERFDIGRHASTHLTFGHGGHYCIGAPLARIELHAVLAQLVPRFPTMRLAVATSELRLRTGQLTGGLVELPVTW